VPGVIDDATKQRGCGRQLWSDFQRLAQRDLCLPIVTELMRRNTGAEEEHWVAGTRGQRLAEEPGGLVRVSGLERGPGALSGLRSLRAHLGWRSNERQEQEEDRCPHCQILSAVPRAHVAGSPSSMARFARRSASLFISRRTCSKVTCPIRWT